MDSAEISSIKSGSRKSLRELEIDPMSMRGTRMLRTLTWIGTVPQFVNHSLSHLDEDEEKKAPGLQR